MFVETIEVVTSFLVTNSTIILTVLAFTLFLVIKSQKFDVWEKQGVNGPKPFPVIGNAWEQFLKPLMLINQERYGKFGTIYGFYEKSTPILSIADPEILRYILNKDSEILMNRKPTNSPDPALHNMLTSLRDEKWKRMRSIMSPTFTSGKMKKMANIINNCIQSLLENIDGKVAEGEEIELKQLYGAYTMDVISSCAFATKTNAHKNPNDPFVKHAKLFLRFSFWRILGTLFIPSFIQQLMNYNLQPSYVLTFFKRTIREIMRQRKQSDVKMHDFMQLLLEAEMPKDLASEVKDVNEEHMTQENQEDIARSTKMLSTAKNGESKLTEDEIIAQSVIFFVAGYETTGALLSYCSYALATNPDVQERLYYDVKQHFDVDKEINYDTISKMKYLNAFISEALRMYTPAIQLHREVSRDYKVPLTNITVPKGGLIQVPIYDMHHDENYFLEPYAFKPERFLPENVSEIRPYSYMPFGSGPRNCIGMRFALMEAKLALCNVILQYKIVKSENTDIPLKFTKNPVPLFPVERVIVRMKPR